MENHAYEVAKARALALCKRVAAAPIRVDEALAHLQAVAALTEDPDEREEIQVLELIFQAVGNVQEIGAALKESSVAEEPGPVVIHRPQAGAVVVPKPSNVR